ncbi:SRPBCC family protein [Nocardioides jiangxiensis]|uniref:SRPBCC family protein n=1 Tax=Nocardioides jiangxiensis TaxID=3064524 RepID=A0ABT9B232_9ACTN|nr:SRPBCC family protein [Nocardioides sp. WY-20]MDO7868909.1 SRPBCC family protein [Nocardioides sp. WY-20]
MTRNDVPELSAAIEIAAPVDDVWRLVSDVIRMPEWSPQVTSVRLRSGFDEVALGAEFTNRNTLGNGLDWTTHATITAYDAPREVAFRIEENWVTWRFVLEPSEVGTLLHQQREAPDGISDLSQQLTDGFMGGTEQFSETMRAGMAETLERIKAAAEKS